MWTNLINMCSYIHYGHTNEPLSESYSRSNRDTTVLLPQPLGPTRASVLPDSTLKLSPCSTGALGRDGYVK